VDAVYGATRLAAMALPIVTSASEVVSAALALLWTTSASGAEIGSPDESRDSWWSVCDCNTRGYCSSYSTSTVDVQWLL
jgi:hypothetical protein